MKKLPSFHPKIALLALLIPGSHSYGKSIFSEYNLGLSYSTTTNYAAISYDTPAMKTIPSDCDTATAQDRGQMRCTAYLAPDGNGAYSVSAYIEKPFERQGLFYFKPGFTLSTITYTGGIVAKPNAPLQGSKSKTTSASQDPNQPPTTAGTAPVDRAYIYMYGLNWQTYLRFGITPQYFPDILASVGVGVQTVAGSVRVFKTKTNTYIVQPDGFGELEIVLVRWNGGYLSGFASQSQTLMTPLGTNLIQDRPSDTETTNYRLGLKNEQLGARMLFPF